MQSSNTLPILMSYARTCPSALPAMISTESGGIVRLVMEDVASFNVWSGSRVCDRMSQSMILASKPAACQLHAGTPYWHSLLTAREDPTVVIERDRVDLAKVSLQASKNLSAHDVP